MCARTVRRIPAMAGRRGFGGPVQSSSGIRGQHLGEPARIAEFGCRTPNEPSSSRASSRAKCSPRCISSGHSRPESLRPGLHSRQRARTRDGAALAAARARRSRDSSRRTRDARLARCRPRGRQTRPARFATPRLNQRGKPKCVYPRLCSPFLRSALHCRHQRKMSLLPERWRSPSPPCTS